MLEGFKIGKIITEREAKELKKKTTEELKELLSELQQEKISLFNWDKNHKTNRYSGRLNTLDNKISKVKEELKNRL